MGRLAHSGDKEGHVQNQGASLGASGPPLPIVMVGAKLQHPQKPQHPHQDLRRADLGHPSLGKESPPAEVQSSDQEEGHRGASLLISA